jgi:glycosyltransferase involved in cell wall biosynthesis
MTDVAPTPATAPLDGGPRVLLVVEQLRRAVPGGIGTYARGLIAGVASVRAGAPDSPAVSLSLLASRAPARPDPLEALGLPLDTSVLPGRLLTRAWDRGLAPAPRGFDLVHAISLAAPPVRTRHGKASTLVVTVHDMAWRHHPETTTSRGRGWHEAALARAITRADVLMVASKEVADDLCEAGARPDAVAVVPLGADHLPPPIDVAPRLAELGIQGPYLLTVGTLEPRKNLPRLFAAYARARPSFPEPWPLVVVGPRGWGEGQGFSDGTPTALPEGVVLAGEVSDAVLAGLYAGARLFAYVPLREGYGLPPLEAMGFSVPVVASTGVPSVLPHGEREASAGEAALRVDPLDVEAMAEALVVAATDETRRAGLVRAGTALAAQRTWHRSAEGHLALWRSRA